LHLLIQDGSMVYDLGSVDISGRVASQPVITAVGWQPGDRLDLVVADGAIVFRRSPDGLWPVPWRPRICIPAHARHRLGIAQGDQVLLAAAPGHSLVIVYPAAALEEMITRYHATHSVGGHEHE
jgi:bifunctional DNA-binding transcriptional regulator/antitoxin component of YhaV-PrlF toxin-antitoxin module